MNDLNVNWSLTPGEAFDSRIDEINAKCDTDVEERSRLNEISAYAWFFRETFDACRTLINNPDSTTDDFSKMKKVLSWLLNRENGFLTMNNNSYRRWCMGVILDLDLSQEAMRNVATYTLDNQIERDSNRMADAKSKLSSAEDVKNVLEDA